MSADERNKLVKRLCLDLSRLMRSEITDDVIYYLLSMESLQDLKDYIKELIDFSSPKANPFLDDLVDCWQTFNIKKQDDEIKIVTKTQFILSKIYIPHFVISISPKKTSKTTKVKLAHKLLKRPLLAKVKKLHFCHCLGLMGRRGLPEFRACRHRCDCQAQRHALVNNCLECGRVVCEQEGSGPCFFCGSLVCTKAEQEILSRNSNKSEKLKSFLMKQEIKEEDYGHVDDDDAGSDVIQKLADVDLMEAIQFKNKLLEFDKTSVKRTRVIDDDCDYFSTDSNKWLRKEERELLRKKEAELREQRFGSRLGPRKYNIDFAGREIKEIDTRNVNMYSPDDDADNLGSGGDHLTGDVDGSAADGGGDYSIHNMDLMRPIFTADDLETSDTSSTTASKNFHLHQQPHHNRMRVVQDSGVQMMVDEGMCLSMHQPWASLLVAGIKKHEGRTWYTAHRGVLWIASTSKRPDETDIDAMENFYKKFYNGYFKNFFEYLKYADENIKFPKTYPSSCLLGRVIVEDCISEDDYKDQFPSGESESPFVLICGDPMELKVKFPIKGKHKIYKLEPSLHKGAKKALFHTLS
ncbi:hypothetical protein HELRODRAFT_183880 [Helobdella robusta]|uniref:ASCH domain-containing protein n=1 Tax=Helobdella robusta TaxID=6412 RepID=T1FKA2_HELRO|nr:hypothetical protein HELRODRAFT_183880 [Helobdella robusta]ESO09785.1 hypothetical protein HELRODRAFT_183880 [Helobdella robusta]